MCHASADRAERYLGSSFFMAVTPYPLNLQNTPRKGRAGSPLVEETLGKGSVTTEHHPGVDPLKDTV